MTMMMASITTLIMAEASTDGAIIIGATRTMKAMTAITMLKAITMADITIAEVIPGKLCSGFPS